MARTRVVWWAGVVAALLCGGVAACDEGTEAVNPAPVADSGVKSDAASDAAKDVVVEAAADGGPSSDAATSDAASSDGASDDGASDDGASDDGASDDAMDGASDG